MTQTKDGARLAMTKILARDPDHFKKIGSVGGKKSRGGGFVKGSESARLAGKKGGITRWERHPYFMKKGETVASETS